ncbi:hypothetical protein Poli38472_008345 [Pythium oligandrum]|uniref:Arrestin C-terminal-like domain-containing protein n=1 Tax=Pythium oligandrum TaxID=41045 RepID=A0A8K1CMN0_PYTOL|nr:hypothetical protein Poli38472_008345 [Pythium oligandrum]|eukprot:TMW65703.1 hypothetical protein Poli38472_008345 [Pythium oligandrum]
MGKLGKEFGIGKKGKISIAIEKPSYIAGEIVRGTIYVSAFEPIQCDAVVLKATGKEKVSWSEEVGIDEPVVEEHEREQEFFKEKVVICAFPHTLEAGEYSYPFQYQLPPTLPGVFSMERYSSMSISNLKASITYKFKATFDVGGYYAKDLKAKTHLVVHEQLTQSIRPSQDSTTQSVNWLCCFNKGTLTLSVAMDKNVYFPGETAQINCQIANNSEVEISAMHCHLYQDITLQLAYGPQTFERKIAEATFPGVPAKTTANQPQPLLLAPTLEGGVMNPSTTGTIIQCAYRVEIECDIPWCPDVQLHLPVTIIAPAVPDPMYMAPPTAGYVAPVPSSV